MAKDDYYTIAAKILVYLYKKYQHKEGLKEDYISPETADFPISKEQLYETIYMLCDQGYITGHVKRAWGGDILVDISSLRIPLITCVKTGK